MKSKNIFSAACIILLCACSNVEVEKEKPKIKKEYSCRYLCIGIKPIIKDEKFTGYVINKFQQIRKDGSLGYITEQRRYISIAKAVGDTVYVE